MSSTQRRQADSPPAEREPSPKRRTRALVACRLCRNRKTRCDNKRPSCGYCTLIGTNCVYPDDPAPADREVHVTNKEILDKVSSAVEILQGLQAAQVGSRVQEPAASSRLEESAFADDGFGHLGVPDTAAKNSSVESILRWPIFASIGYQSTATSLGLEAASLHPPTADVRQGVVAHDGILSLCQRFLSLIHIKNPILDVAEFTRHARHAAEYGPGWDEGACLVLLACALACVAVPFDPELEDSSSASQGEDKSAAEAYFGSAQRRLGLLQPSLVSVQCHYLAGLYSKFLVRPLVAWNLFQSACNQLQALLYARGLVGGNAERIQNSSRSRHIEQRLYWSCVKAESELRIELQLPSTGRIKYPDLFPSLSFPVTSEIQTLDGSAHAGTPNQGLTPWSPAAWQCSPQDPNAPVSGSGLHPDEERSWLYYLAEISLRSIMNRVLTGLYDHPEDPRTLMQKQAQYFDELQEWYTALPLQLSFQRPSLNSSSADSCADRPENELAFFLQTRYVGVLEWIYRPSLALVMKGSLGNLESLETLLSAATGAVNAAVLMIDIVSFHHRHGGIWGLVRRLFGAALVLIAVIVHSRRSDKRHQIHTLQDVDFYLDMSITTIRRWGADGGEDLQRMEDILKELRDTAARV